MPYSCSSPSFGPAGPYTTYGAPQGVAMADLNHDAVPDLAGANEGASNVSIPPGTGDGTFGPATYYSNVNYWIVERLLEQALIDKQARSEPTELWASTRVIKGNFPEYWPK